jgi:hypothetical protein
MKLFSLIFCLLFLFSAVLQYNDPDPYLWAPIYMYGSVLCWLAFREKYYPALYLTGIAVYAVYAGFLFFQEDGVLDWYRDHHSENLVQSMKATKPWIEATREFLGLLILSVVLLVNYFYIKRKSRSR